MSGYIPVLKSSAFVAAIAKGEHTRSFHFRALLFSALAMSAQQPLSFARRVEVNDVYDTGDSESEYLADTARRALVLSELDGPCLSSVVTCIHMFVMCDWAKKKEDAWLYIQKGVTRAQQLGLDKWTAEEEAAPESQKVFLSTRLRIYLIL